MVPTKNVRLVNARAEDLGEKIQTVTIPSESSTNEDLFGHELNTVSEYGQFVITEEGATVEKQSAFDGFKKEMHARITSDHSLAQDYQSRLAAPRHALVGLLRRWSRHACPDLFPVLPVK